MAKRSPASSQSSSYHLLQLDSRCPRFAEVRNANQVDRVELGQPIGASPQGFRLQIQTTMTKQRLPPF